MPCSMHLQCCAIWPVTSVSGSTALFVVCPMTMQFVTASSLTTLNVKAH